MEKRRRQTDPSSLKNGEEYSEVYLEPIEDLTFERPRRAEPLFPRRKKRSQRGLIALLCCVILLATMVIVYSFVSHQKRVAAEIATQVAAEEALRAQQEQQRIELERLSTSTVFLDGITVNGVDVGGMTMEEARAALASVEGSLGAQRELQLVYNNVLYSIDLASLSYTTNLQSVLTEAYYLGKMGDYTKMKAEADDVETNGRAYTITASYDLTSLKTRVAELAAQIDVPAQNASVKSVDTENRKIVFGEAIVGIAVEQDVLLERVTDAVLNGVAVPIAIPVVETQPVISRADIEGAYVLRASATTNFSSSTSARKYNVRKGCGMINGTILKPGETFSTNDTLGTRTKGNGWKEANAYESGAVVPQYGGGVCQLSTTLYNAIVKGDLEVVTRRCHSMPVTYVDKGLDATINSVGNIIDFQFKNNTQGDIVIFGYTTSSDRLTFEVWGLPFDTTEYDEIKLTSEQVSKTGSGGSPVEIVVPVGQEKADGSLMSAGETYVAITARDGYVYQSYKNYYKNGSVVRREKLAASTYKAYQGEIWICLAADSPTPTAPSDTPEPLPPDPEPLPVDPSPSDGVGG